MLVCVCACCELELMIRVLCATRAAATLYIILSAHICFWFRVFQHVSVCVCFLFVVVFCSLHCVRLFICFILRKIRATP